ncbi:hypothetical protein J6590_008356 [Homalodisca vitripennis]|nr:hypothetical protein J6590_008356 [Homalodisca vitripennis]
MDWGHYTIICRRETFTYQFGVVWEARAFFRIPCHVTAQSTEYYANCLWSPTVTWKRLKYVDLDSHMSHSIAINKSCSKSGTRVVHQSELNFYTAGSVSNMSTWTVMSHSIAINKLCSKSGTRVVHQSERNIYTAGSVSSMSTWTVICLIPLQLTNHAIKLELLEASQVCRMDIHMSHSIAINKSCNKSGIRGVRQSERNFYTAGSVSNMSTWTVMSHSIAINKSCSKSGTRGVHQSELNIYTAGSVSSMSTWTVICLIPLQLTNHAINLEFAEYTRYVDLDSHMSHSIAINKSCSKSGTRVVHQSELNFYTAGSVSNMSTWTVMSHSIAINKSCSKSGIRGVHQSELNFYSAGSVSSVSIWTVICLIPLQLTNHAVNLEFAEYTRYVDLDSHMSHSIAINKSCSKSGTRVVHQSERNIYTAGSVSSMSTWTVICLIPLQLTNNAVNLEFAEYTRYVDLDSHMSHSIAINKLCSKSGTRVVHQSERNIYTAGSVSSMSTWTVICLIPLQLTNNAVNLEFAEYTRYVDLDSHMSHSIAINKSCSKSRTRVVHQSELNFYSTGSVSSMSIWTVICLIPLQLTNHAVNLELAEYTRSCLIPLQLTNHAVNLELAEYTGVNETSTQLEASQVCRLGQSPVHCSDDGRQTLREDQTSCSRDTIDVRAWRRGVGELLY